jgi:citrate synthase
VLLSAREAARRLGIKPDTLYAYVSRGLLQSVAVAGSRQRGYHARAVERFAATRGTARNKPAVAALTPAIVSAISLIEDHRLYYRGHDALALAETTTLEEVARLLWQDASAPPAPTRPLARASLPRKHGRVRAGAGTAGVSLGLIERCQIRLARLSAEDPVALDLSRAGVVRTGSLILDELALAIGAARGAEPVHCRLAATWRLDEAGADLVRRCLVLLADHELNASTFVARCVASTGATPYAAVSAALAALSGRRHGGASAQAEALFHEIAAGGEPMAALAARLARNEILPGFGQPLYPDGDPRAAAILGAIAARQPAAWVRIEPIVAAAGRLVHERPNVDFALAAATAALGLPQGSALALFILGRAGGWIAHAIEQYESGVLIRPRARYTGPRPANRGGSADTPREPMQAAGR